MTRFLRATRASALPHRREADALNKYATTINKLEGDVGLSDTVAVFRKLTTFLRANAPEEVKRILPILDLFVKSHLNG